LIPPIHLPAFTRFLAREKAKKPQFQPIPQRRRNIHKSLTLSDSNKAPEVPMAGLEATRDHARSRRETALAQITRGLHTFTASPR
jgi:hypothetical protein